MFREEGPENQGVTSEDVKVVTNLCVVPWLNGKGTRSAVTLHFLIPASHPPVSTISTLWGLRAPSSVHR